MPNWSGGEVAANSVRLHYTRTGGEKPVLVLCHGIGDDGLCWTRVARALEDVYDVVMPDARGHGRSEAPAGGYAPEEQARDVAGLVDALGIRRAAFGGHSMGARALTYLAVQRPDLVRALFLEDPPLGSHEDQPLAVRAAKVNEVRAWLESVRGLAHAELRERAKGEHPAWPDDELDPWVASKLRARPVVDSFADLPAIPWRERFAALRCPTLLITGDTEQGALVTPAESAEAARLAPRLRVAYFTGAGHDIRRDRFHGYVDAVRSFLAEGD